MSDRSRKVRRLKEFYAEVDSIINAKLPKETTSQDDFAKYCQKANVWASDCANWVKSEMGELAQARFLDRSNMQDVSIIGAYNRQHGTVVQNLSRFKSNLRSMIENPAWDND